MTLANALNGLQIVEVATYIPGPVCTQILAGLGAEVIKIERPGGDPLRTLPPLDASGRSPLFAALNAGKRCIELDLKTADGAAELRSLAAGADVLVDGLRPGALEKLGLGPVALRALNPKLLYCAISGFGLTGADNGRAGHDLNFMGLSGFLAMNGVGGAAAVPGTQLADMVSGLAAATAILAGLQARGRDGRGRLIDAPMLESARWLMSPWLAAAQAGLTIAPEPGHTLSGAQACYRIYRAADGGHLAVAALEPHFWARFCQTIGRPDLIERQDDADQPALIAEVGRVIAARPLSEWAERFAGVDACVTPVLSVAEAAAAGVTPASLPARSVD